VLSQVNPPLFKLIDLQGASVPGFYYESQLTKSPPPGEKDYFFVEKTLKRKTVKGKKYFFVKYLFYPAKFNQWVAEEDINFGEIDS